MNWIVVLWLAFGWNVAVYVGLCFVWLVGLPLIRALEDL